MIERIAQGEDFMVEVSGKMDGVPSITKPTNGEGKPEFNTLDEPIHLTIVNSASQLGSGIILLNSYWNFRLGTSKLWVTNSFMSFTLVPRLHY